MAFRVSAAGFEGPFDLLLQLVARQKVDIGAVSVGDISDQYLAEVARLGDLDLEVASDFVLVASTLLEIKASSLLPDEEAHEDDDEFAGLTPAEMRDVLIARLLAYRQFKMAAAALEARGLAESYAHPRTAGPDPEFLHAMPDYLEGITLPTFGLICADFLGKRETFLLESEHIAAKRIPLEVRVEQVDDRVRAARHLTFEELLDGDRSVENRVVSLLALLELNKRHMVTLDQPQTFGTITIDAVEGAPAFAASVEASGLSVEG